MENENIDLEIPENKKLRFGCLQVLGIVVVTVLVTALLSGWWVKRNLYASPFKPTELNAGEREVLESKLQKLEAAAAGKSGLPPGPLEPEPYTEEGAKREISLTEKELNALIANDPETARRVAVDLSDNLVSVKLLVPMNEDVFILGGKTLRINLGVILGYEDGRTVFALKGLSLGGVPLPNAWLGGLKNRNLVEEFGSEGGFWKLFSDGVEDLTIEEGHLRVKLKE